MTTVAEIKADLMEQRVALSEVAELSISSINTIVSFSSWVLGIVAFGLAVLTYVGWVTIKNAAQKLAEERVKQYIQSSKFKDWLKDTVVKAYEADRYKERVQSKVEIVDDPPAAEFEEREYSDG